MTIQIFGKKKCFNTKKAQRYFKERGIKFQFIDILEKGLSKGELRSVSNAVGGIDPLLDEKSKDFHLVNYLIKDQREEKLMEIPAVYKTPIVRNGKKASVGYVPETWKNWE